MEWRNIKHGQQWVNTLTTYATPVLGETCGGVDHHGPGLQGFGADLLDKDRDGHMSKAAYRNGVGLVQGARLLSHKRTGLAHDAEKNTQNSSMNPYANSSWRKLMASYQM